MMTLFLLAALLQSTPPLRAVDKGDQSNIDEPRQIVARTAAEWETLWREHAPGRKQPQVDFGRDMIAGVFLGTRPTAGYGVEILSASNQGGTLIVRYRETRPAADAITAQIITSPYHLVAPPRHEGEVRFERVP
jgi:hypothetical protein